MQKKEDMMGEKSANSSSPQKIKEENEKKSNLTKNEIPKFYIKNGFGEYTNTCVISAEYNDLGDRVYWNKNNLSLLSGQFKRLFDKTPSDLKRYYLHFRNGTPMKFIIDYDQKVSLGIKMPKDYIGVIEYEISKWLSELFKTDVSYNLYDSTRESKISRHILYHGIYFTNVEYGKQLLHFIKDKLYRKDDENGYYKQYADLIDDQIYKNGGSVRFYNCHKISDIKSKKVEGARFIGKNNANWSYHFHSCINFNYELCVDNVFKQSLLSDKSYMSNGILGDNSSKKQIYESRNNYNRESSDLEAQIKNLFTDDLLKNQLIDSYNSLNDKTHWKIIGFENKGYLGVQLRLRHIYQIKYKCMCCGKDNSDQDHILQYKIIKKTHKIIDSIKNISSEIQLENNVTIQNINNFNSNTFETQNIEDLEDNYYEEDSDDYEEDIEESVNDDTEDSFNSVDNDNTKTKNSTKNIKYVDNLFVVRKCWHDNGKLIPVYHCNQNIPTEIYKKYMNIMKKQIRDKLTERVKLTIKETLPLDIKYDFEFNSKYICDSLQPEMLTKKCSLIHGEPGCGKTRFLINFINQFKSKGQRNNCIIIANRQSYAYFSHKIFSSLGFKNYLNKDTKEILGKKPPSRVIISLQSFWRLNINDIFYHDIIIDESEACLSSFNSKTLNQVIQDNTTKDKTNKDKNCDKNLELCSVRAMKSIKNFVTVLNKSNRTIFLDGFLTQKTYDFCIKLFGIENIFSVRNRYRTMEFNATNFSHISAFEQNIYSCIQNGDNISIAVNINKYARKIQDRILTKFPDLAGKILLVNKDDTENNLISILLNDSKLSNFRVLIYTPKLLNGVSIDIKNHFSSIHLYVGNNSCCVRDICQMLRRIRNPISNNLYFFCEDFVTSGLPLSYHKLYQQCYHISRSTTQVLRSHFIPDFYDLPSCIISAITNTILEDNYSQTCIKEVLLGYLNYLGCTISTNDDDSSDQIKISSDLTQLFKSEKDKQTLSIKQRIIDNLDIPSDSDYKNIITHNSININRFHNSCFQKRYLSIISTFSPHLLPFYLDVNLELDIPLFQSLMSNPDGCSQFFSSKGKNLTLLTPTLNNLKLINSPAHDLFFNRIKSPDLFVPFLLSLHPNFISATFSNISSLVPLYNSMDSNTLAFHLQFSKWLLILKLPLSNIYDYHYPRSRFNDIPNHYYDKLHSLLPKSTEYRHIPVKYYSEQHKFNLFKLIMSKSYSHSVSSFPSELLLINNKNVQQYDFSIDFSLPSLPLFSLIRT